MITWIINIFLSFFFLLDQIVYGLIESLYQMILQIANISVISQASMQEFANRIYVLVGVVMLFKVAFSLIQLFANPDKMSDSTMGAGSLVKRIIISLVLLVMAPTIFQLAFRIQGTILNAGILEKVILDSDVAPDGQNPIDVDCSLEENQAYRVCGGRTIAFAIFRGFVTPNENLYEENENGEQVLSSDYADYEENVEAYNEAVKEQNIGKLLDPILAGESGDRPFNYSFLISTIAGAFAAWTLFMFCFDVAIRAVKLAFLQLLAPVPILARVEPKSDKVFNNWLKECISTYLEVFVRLIALYFVVFIIQEISANGLFSFYEYTAEGATKQAEDVGLLATAFIVLGLLMFAQKAPKLISDIFGVKSGDFTMNPFKKSPVIGGAVGLAAGTAIGGMAAAQAAKANGKNPIGAALKGALTGGARGANAGSREKSFMKTLGAAGDASTRYARKIPNNTEHATPGGRMLAVAQRMGFMKTAGQRDKEKVDSYNRYNKSAKAFSDRAKAQAQKKDNKAKGIMLRYDEETQQRNRVFRELNGGTHSRYSIEAGLESAKASGNKDAIEAYSVALDDWDKQMSEDIASQWEREYRTDPTTVSDAEALQHLTDMSDEVADNKAYYSDIEGFSAANSVSDNSKAVASANAQFQNSEEYKRNRDNDQYAESAVGPIFQTKGK